MNCKNRIIFLLAITFFVINALVAEDKSEPLVDYEFFRAPEAAAFKKYGEQQVNEYTGNANITVPLYEIKNQDIEIPLVLRYDASGIKVSQEASWVGLGWNMMIGGCINLVRAGALDNRGLFNCRTKEQVNNWETFLSSNAYNTFGNDPCSKIDKVPYHTSYFIQHGFGTETPTEYVSPMEYVSDLEGGFGEQDFYSVSLFGKSFQFMINPFSDTCVIIGDSPEKFIIEQDCNSSCYERKYWKITDSDGWIYYFEPGDELYDDPKGSYTSSWYVSKVISPLGREASFSYIKRAIRPRTIMSETYRWVITLPNPTNRQEGLNREYIHRREMRTYLTRISTGNQDIRFYTTTCKESDGMKLDSISIISTSANKVVKSFKFSYDYLEHSNVGGQYNSETVEGSGERSGKRLNLLSVTEISSDRRDSLQTRFEYDATLLPAKSSCSQDRWGYYNGQENSTKGCDYNTSYRNTMIYYPTRDEHFGFFSTSSPMPPMPFKSNRRCNPDVIQAAILKKVIYPTKGYTTYQYEPNDYNSEFKESDLYGEEKKPDFQFSIYRSYTPGSSGMTFSAEANAHNVFTVEKNTLLKITVNASGTNAYPTDTKGVFLIRPINGAPIESREFLVNTVREYSISLNPGKYEIIIQGYSQLINNNSSNISVYVQGFNSDGSSDLGGPQSYIVRGGGLRIQEIANYDNDNTLIERIVYDYTDRPGHSSGILFQKQRSVRTVHHCIAEWDVPQSSISNGAPSPFTNKYTYYDVLEFTGGHSDYNAFMETHIPGAVGYSMVSKSFYDKNGVLCKKIVSKYENNDSGLEQGIQRFTDFGNGSLLSEAIYNGKNELVRETQNTYRKERKVYRCNVVNTMHYVSTVLFIDFSYYRNLYLLVKYPYIHSVSYLDGTTKTEYQNGKPICSKEIRYDYNPENNRVSMMQESISGNTEILRTKITYVDDYMSNFTRNKTAVKSKILSMYNTDTKKETIIRKEQNNYAYYVKKVGNTLAENVLDDTSVNRGFLYPTNQYISIGNGSLTPLYQYKYDSNSNDNNINLKEVIAKNTYKTVFLWSYSNMYPIAKIEGVSFDVVCSILGKDFVSNLSKKAKPEESDYKTIRSKLTMVSTYTYDSLHHGITSETLPNGVTTNYEYDSFGRLKTAKDAKGNIISEYQYNYKK